MKRLSDISNVREILSEHGFKFSKALGQNFLINPTVCPRMAQACLADKSSGVIEIGPGIGVLTQELATVAGKVVAIELDKRLLPVLDETLSDFNNVKIINDDILKIDLKGLIEKEFAEMQVSVCANLPYYITSPVIMKLLESRLPIKSLTVMVQREAAQRICAEPGSRNVGAVSIAVRYYAEPEILFKVSSGSFMPAPNVDSAVIRLNIRDNPCVEAYDEGVFFAVVKAAFSQRRKTLVNALSSGLNISKEKLIADLDKLGLPAAIRAEQLSMQQFADIANKISENKTGSF